MEKIVHPENLREAFLRAVRGKSNRLEVLRFRADLDASLCDIRAHLLSGNYPFGKYRFFTIHDPKERLICAAPFADRVAFHAMMRISHPIFDAYQIYDSYASRVGKGGYKALERAQYFAGHYEWFAKLDVRHYFDSIDHEIVMHQLESLFKDKLLLAHFRCLLDSYHTQQGKGLPIGNLTSQYFANHYLSVADHYAKETLRVPAMVRYMDDVLLFAHDKEELFTWVKNWQNFLSSTLLLELHPPVLNKTVRGIPFLGYVVYQDKLRLNQRSRTRYIRKIKQLVAWLKEGIIEEKEYRNRLEALTAFIEKADTRAYRRKVFSQEGMVSVEQALTA